MADVKQEEMVKPVVPRGKAIQHTDEELDAMTSAEAMEELASEAAADWKENAPKRAKRLLDSQPEKSE